MWLQMPFARDPSILTKYLHKHYLLFKTKLAVNHCRYGWQILNSSSLILGSFQLTILHFEALSQQVTCTHHFMRYRDTFFCSGISRTSQKMSSLPISGLNFWKNTMLTGNHRQIRESSLERLSRKSPL